ncbi:hypothetical protein BKA57DRAFT_449264, partial [Linnemannia elongata]
MSVGQWLFVVSLCVAFASISFNLEALCLLCLFYFFLLKRSLICICLLSCPSMAHFTHGRTSKSNMPGRQTGEELDIYSMVSLQAPFLCLMWHWLSLLFGGLFFFYLSAV